MIHIKDAFQINAPKYNLDFKEKYLYDCAGTQVPGDMKERERREREREKKTRVSFFILYRGRGRERERKRKGG